MEANNGGRTAALFLAILGVSAAVGLGAMRFAGEASPDAQAKTDAEPQVPAEATKTPVSTEAPRPAPKRKTKITWEGGGTSGTNNDNVRVYAGPARPSFGSGAVNQPGPPPRFSQHKITREQLPNGKVRITLYRTN